MGTYIHNVELTSGEGGKLARAAGTSVQLVARENIFATLRLPSGEFRLVSQTCWSTIGQIGNVEKRNENFRKAGRIRWLGWRPTVRGSVINPVDHPHGGGEGRCPIGRSPSRGYLSCASATSARAGAWLRSQSCAIRLHTSSLGTRCGRRDGEMVATQGQMS